jgi:hypothetical protein
LAPALFIASTSISFPPPKTEQELLEVHPSQALVFVVVTHAVVESTFVIIPFSVAINIPSAYYTVDPE